MWADELDPGVRSKLNMIAESLCLPGLHQYQNHEHFLADAYSRIRGAGALACQVAAALGGQVRHDGPFIRAKS
jgi:hypothetical protein